MRTIILQKYYSTIFIKPEGRVSEERNKLLVARLDGTVTFPPMWLSRASFNTLTVIWSRRLPCCCFPG